MIEPGAIEIAQAIASGKLLAVEACEAAIRRIEVRDAAINAVMVRDFERARIDARAADASIAAGVHTPLLGVPMTVKESFTLAGHPATWGLSQFRELKAVEDGSTVKRLRAAGAVILGKTNVSVSLADVQAVNPIYGRTVNPFDATRTPGGSSGGSAAALAAGMVPLEMGSDIGGSIRIPAHFCGVYGHKPTYGIVPLDGHPFPGTDGADTPLAVAGPLARCTADLAVALDVVSEVILPRSAIKTLNGARLFVLTEHPRALASRAIVDGIDALAAKAERGGATIVRHSALLPDLSEIFVNWLAMLNVALSGGHAEHEGKPVGLSTWFDLLNAQARNQRAWRQFFSEYDALLCPVYGVTAFAHNDEPDMRKRALDVDGKSTPFGAQFSWITMATLGGLPATSAPIGKDALGLPFGVQIMCDRLQDHKAIGLARLLTEGLHEKAPET
jgi:amidase